MERKVAIEFCGSGGSTVKWVAVRTLDEFKIDLKSQGAKDFARYSRCKLTNDGVVHGKLMPLNLLSEEDISWAVEEDSANSRYLLCRL